MGNKDGRKHITGGMLNMADSILEKHRNETDAPKTIAEEIQQIMDEAMLHTQVLDKPGSLIAFDPRRDFAKALKMAKETGSEELIESVYEKLIEFHERERYTYEAAKTAIKAGLLDKAMELIYKLVDWKRGPDYEGALELAQLMGGEYIDKVNSAINSSKADKKRVTNEKNESTKSRFEQDQILSIKKYKTKSGSEYRLNINGVIFRNGEVFTRGGNTYTYVGIIETEHAWERFQDRFFYGSHDNLSTAKAWKILLDSGYIKPEAVPFDDIEANIQREISMIGVNEEKDEAILTSKIVE